MRQFLLAAFLCVNSIGLTHAALFTDDEAQKKIGELQQQLSKLQQQLQQQGQASDARMAKFEEGLTRLETTLRNQNLVELLSQVEALKADMAKLRGQGEVQAHDIETTQKKQKDLYLDLDTRLRNLERSGAAAVAPAAAPAAVVMGGAVPVAAGDPAAETRNYDAALNLFKLGNYQGAIAGFQNFIGGYPKSNLAANAQYWIGNAYFNLHDFKSAIAAQQKLISTYPGNQKAPDAMLNLASSQLELADNAGAKKTLEELVAKYPVSPATDLAKKRLSSIK
jgi:tol-pal system protein YbgF